MKQETLDLLKELSRVPRSDQREILLDQPDWTGLTSVGYPREEIEDPLVVLIAYDLEFPLWVDQRAEHLGNTSQMSVWRFRDAKDVTELALTTPLLSKSILLG